MADENAPAPEPRAFAMVKDGEVINRVLWDGDPATWQPPEGVDMVEEGRLPAKTPPLSIGDALDTTSPAIAALVEIAPAVIGGDASA